MNSSAHTSCLTFRRVHCVYCLTLHVIHVVIYMYIRFIVDTLLIIRNYIFSLSQLTTVRYTVRYGIDTQVSWRTQPHNHIHTTARFYKLLQDIRTDQEA